MLFRRYGTFVGGIDLPDQKHATENLPIQPHAPVSPLRVPLAVCGTKPARPTVEPGQPVSEGQKIAEAPPGTAVDVFSPVAGSITAMTTAELAAGDDFLPCPAIEIEPEGDAFSMDAGRESFEWQSASPEALCERIFAGGLTTCRRRIVPLREWIEKAKAKRCSVIIANGMENQPYVTADHRLLIERGREVVEGLAILARAVGVGEAILAVDWRRTDDYDHIVGPARAHDVSRVALPHKYPTGADAMLVKVLTKRERPPGGSVMDVGVAVVSPAACFAVYRWAVCGQRPTGRAVTVAGPRAGRPRNCWVPFGTRCLDLVNDADQPVIHNGPMTGVRCPPAGVVGPATDAVLALEATVPASPSPCIRCSWCTDYCPARLNVAALNDAFELGDINRADRLVATACVECGVCTYVCPARLPLSQRVKRLKRALGSMEEAMPLFAEH